MSRHTAFCSTALTSLCVLDAASYDSSLYCKDQWCETVTDLKSSAYAVGSSAGCSLLRIQSCMLSTVGRVCCILDRGGWLIIYLYRYLYNVVSMLDCYYYN